MKAIHGWFTFIRYVSRYILSTWGVMGPPDVTKNYDGLLYVIGQFTKWNRYMRVRGAEHIPRDHPVVFCANHVMFGDPLYVFNAVYQGTDKQVVSRAMARDNFFEGTLLKTRFFDADDLMLTLGIHGISRGSVTMAQMKTFVGLLTDGHNFMMFPGRTRSRSGLFFEYRDDFTEPGGASFFIALAQRKQPETTFSVVPLSRNYNPARDHTCLIFGEEMFLPPKAGKEVQRDFDFEVVERIAMLSEVNVSQVVSALMYTVCLHHLADSVPDALIKKWVKAVRASSTHPYWDEEDDADLDAAVDLAMRFLHKEGIIQYRNGVVTPDTETILKVFEPGTKLMKENPVQFLTNQILHLAELTDAIQDALLNSELNA